MGSPDFGVWLRTCPKKQRRKVAELLTPYLGIVRAEEEAASAGGRCVVLCHTLAEAQTLAKKLRAFECNAGAGEVAPWP